MGRIGDDPKRRERNPMLGRDSRRNMRFHVHCNRAGPFVKPPLGVGTGKRYVGPRNIAK
jgi:hypothetical protein